MAAGLAVLSFRESVFDVEEEIFKNAYSAVNTGRKIPKTPIENSPVLQGILIMPALQSGVLRP